MANKTPAKIGRPLGATFTDLQRTPMTPSMKAALAEYAKGCDTTASAVVRGLIKGLLERQKA